MQTTTPQAEETASRRRATDGAVFTVGQRVSFIDPQSGIYTDGVVVCFQGNDQVEVGYHRSGWSDPKYNRIVSIFTLLTIACKPLRRFPKGQEGKSRPSSKMEVNKGTGDSSDSSSEAPKGADGLPMSMISMSAHKATSESDEASSEGQWTVATCTSDSDEADTPSMDVSYESCGDESRSPALDNSSPRSEHQAASSLTSTTSTEEAPSATSSTTASPGAVVEHPPPEPSLWPATKATHTGSPPCPDTTHEREEEKKKEGIVEEEARQEGDEVTAAAPSSSSPSSSRVPSPSPLPSPVPASSSSPVDSAAKNPSVLSTTVTSTFPAFAENIIPLVRPPTFTSTYPGSSDQFVETVNKSSNTSVASRGEGGLSGTSSSSSSALFGGPFRSNGPWLDGMDSWEAARVMVELRESFLRISSNMVSYLNGPAAAAAAAAAAPPPPPRMSAWSQPQLMPMAPSMPMEHYPYHQQQLPQFPHHLSHHHHQPMMNPWQPMGDYGASGPNPLPFKKRKWQV